MKFKFLVLPVLFFLCAGILPNLATAFGPTTHTYLVDQFLQGNTPIANECRNYRAEFEAGAVIPDISVKFYTTEAGAKYKVTHNWNFQGRCMAHATDESQKCFCLGIAIGHYAPDTVSHTQWIPGEIPKWQVPNVGIHPILEGILETYIINTHPDIYKRAQTSLDILLPTRPDGSPNPVYRQDLIDLTKYSISDVNPDQLINVPQEVKWLSGWLGSFYTNVYFAPQIYAGISAVVSHTNSGKDYFDQWMPVAEKKMNDFSNNYANIDRTVQPSGFTSLTLADQTVHSTAYGLLKVPTGSDYTNGWGIFTFSLIRDAIIVVLVIAIVLLFMLFFPI